MVAPLLMFQIWHAAGICKSGSPHRLRIIPPHAAYILSRYPVRRLAAADDLPT